MKKAFSLLEIIFVITLIALISSYILKNNSTLLDKATITKVKTEIALIRNALNINKNKRILQGLSAYPSVLDNAKTNTQNELLFGGTTDNILLTHPLIATTTFQKKAGMFAKVSSLSYHLYISNNTFVVFKYNSNDGTFSCEDKQSICEELD